MIDSAQQVRDRTPVVLDELCAAVEAHLAASDGSERDWLNDALVDANRHSKALAALASTTPPDRADLIARIDAETEGLVTPNDRGRLLLDCRAALASVAQPEVVGEDKPASYPCEPTPFMTMMGAVMMCKRCGHGYDKPADCPVAHPSPVQGVSEAMHSDDAAVDRFAAKMKTKLAVARAKGRGGWDDPERCSPDVLRPMLHEHVAKGDPIDVANFAMMLEHWGASTAPPAPVQGAANNLAALIARIPEATFWRIGHDGEGPDPSLFKATLFDPDEMIRPCEGLGLTSADALREALDKFARTAPTPSIAKDS